MEKGGKKEGNCKDCRKWEEDLYWTHFQSLHFVQFLSGDFDHQLAIPIKFINNLKENLSKMVTIKGPSGCTWKIGIKRIGDTFLFNDGWNEFVKDHSLHENDILIFKYDSDSHFDVLMFDHQNLCEKENSYFVRKCDHIVEENNGCSMKRKAAETLEVTDNSSSEDDGLTLAAKCGKEELVTAVAASAIRTRANRKIPRGSMVEFASKESSRTKNWAYPLQYESKRRDVTEEEKEKALKSANEALTGTSFIVVMRPSHVYKGFFMSIPIEWGNVHLPPRTHDIILRVGEKKWHARYYRKDCRSGLTGGWRNFATENVLEEFDVCLFTLAASSSDHGSGDGGVVLDVGIFRVVEEVIPPRRLTVSPPARRGRRAKFLMRKASGGTSA